MRKILRFLKRIWLLNFLRRIYHATTFYNKKYLQILKWGFQSREDTNYTYHLTPENLQYLAAMISVVTGTPHATILAYFKEAEENLALKTAIQDAMNKSELRKFADKEVRFARRLGWYAMTRIRKPKIVVETGVDKGLGAVLLCAALLRNREEGFPGRYYGTDINPEAGYLLTGTYAETGQILYGDSIESLSKFTEKIDLFINDSDHSVEYEYREYQTIRHLLEDDSIILSDNAEISDKLARFALETGRHFLFFQEVPANHWYPGAGIGFYFK
jgi:predicted O-methyltransferase YrrM